MLIVEKLDDALHIVDTHNKKHTRVTILYPSNVKFCCMIDKTPVESRSHRKHTSTKKHTRTLTNNVSATLSKILNKNRRFKELTKLNQNIQRMFNESVGNCRWYILVGRHCMAWD